MYIKVKTEINEKIKEEALKNVQINKEGPVKKIGCSIYH